MLRATRTTSPSLKLLVTSLTLLVLTAGGSSAGGQVTPTTTAPTATPTEQVPALSTALVTYTGHTKAVISVAWSPDGTRLASCSDDGTVQVWTAADGHRLAHGSALPLPRAVGGPRLRPMYRCWRGLCERAMRDGTLALSLALS